MDTKTTTEKAPDAPEAVDEAGTTTPGADAADGGTGKGDAGAGTGPAADSDSDADGGAEGLGEDLDEDSEEGEDTPAPASSGIAGAAAAVVSAALGVVALTGGWGARIVAERETLVGQISTSGSGTPAQQISEIYGDAWHSTALVNGVFAFVALFVAVLVLILPARPAWVRAVAVAGAVLGAIGVIISAGIYFDLFFDLPTAGS
ncbi:hypothetical protein ACIQCR_08460 [Streptomyces sp. NPDC093249]|uniref:hypothetical protein n=1 Tax=unclassified Streptomyces TaxID=2593676 RepID=UPI0038243CD4